MIHGEKASYRGRNFFTAARKFFGAAIFFLAAGISRGEGTNEILLHARTAIVHGEQLRYEPQTNKNCLGYWTKAGDWAEWKFTVPKPGAFELEVWQGCGKGNGGSDVRVECNSQSFDFVVGETGHFQSFIPRRLGRIHFWKAGEYSLAIKPQNKKAAAVMDIRQVKLLKITSEADSSLVGDLLGARRIVFLGDSITYGGEYIEYLETFLRCGYPAAEFDIINLGLPSETVSGLSEPGHAGGQFPRPDLHERLDRILERAKPDLIFACYGMNDGIYHPFSEERFAKFREGIIKLHEKGVAAGARVIHLTPPTFDPLPLKGRTLPPGLAEYKQPFDGYNQVLDAYSEWLISKHADGWEIIDIHGPMNATLADKRLENPNFRFAGDGVHAGPEGHMLMAKTLFSWAPDSLEAWKQLFPRGQQVLELVQKRQRLRKDAWLTEIGHKRPGMSKGKPIAEAEKEADQLAFQIAEAQDPQFPGKRSLWNGFNSYEFSINGAPVRLIEPQWQVVKTLVSLDPSYLKTSELGALRFAGSGNHLLVATGKIDASNFAARHGLVSDPKLLEPVVNGLKIFGPRDEFSRPLIRKLGTVDLDLVETTPVVISNRLWRFEWVRDGYWDNERKTNYFRFRDPAGGEVTEAFADGHEFGSVFVNEGKVYVSGTNRRGEINIFASSDLKKWETWNAIPAGKYGIFNTSICKANGEFVLMFEIDKPAEEAGVAFTARFAKSKDLRTWTMTPPECNYAKDRYTAPHCLRWLDGWFYNFYLEAHDGYEMRVVRSKDLVKWEASPLNPVLKASPDDKRIANARMSDAHRTRVANAVNLNNSDIDFCEFEGQLRITYSWGNQQGVEHLAEAIYDGTEAQFLRGWFPGKN